MGVRRARSEHAPQSLHRHRNPLLLDLLEGLVRVDALERVVRLDPAKLGLDLTVLVALILIQIVQYALRQMFYF